VFRYISMEVYAFGFNVFGQLGVDHKHCNHNATSNCVPRRVCFNDAVISTGDSCSKPDCGENVNVHRDHHEESSHPAATKNCTDTQPTALPEGACPPDSKRHCLTIGWHFVLFLDGK
jgi:hypothetical protein